MVKVSKHKFCIYSYVWWFGDVDINAECVKSQDWQTNFNILTNFIATLSSNQSHGFLTDYGMLNGSIPEYTNLKKK